MTDQVYSMGKNEERECGHEREKMNVLDPTLARILEGLKIVQVVSGIGKTLFLTQKMGLFTRELIREIEKTGLTLDEFFELSINAVKEIKGEVGLE